MHSSYLLTLEKKKRKTKKKPKHCFFYSMCTFFHVQVHCFLPVTLFYTSIHQMICRRKKLCFTSTWIPLYQLLYHQSFQHLLQLFPTLTPLQAVKQKLQGWTDLWKTYCCWIFASGWTRWPALDGTECWNLKQTRLSLHHCLLPEHVKSINQWTGKQNEEGQINTTLLSLWWNSSGSSKHN